MLNQQSTTTNKLLARLSLPVQEQLQPYLQWVHLALGDVLYESGRVQNYVYFPTNAVIALLYELENGTSAEIALVGNEGLLGVALVMGGDRTTGRAVVQSAGGAYRLCALQLKTELNCQRELLPALLNYVQALIAQMAQTGVCNRHHNIDQQLCRWLLLSLDRLSGNELIMTQELIANMLGVRREGVTEAAGRLQKLGIIEYHRGHITVLNRSKLERQCCECYSVVQREADRLLSVDKKTERWIKREALQFNESVNL